MIYFQLGVFLVLACLVLGNLVVTAAAAEGRDLSSSGRARGWGEILIWLVALICLSAGLSKLAHFAPAVDEMRTLGLTGWKYDLVAGIEIANGVLLLVRPLRSVALLLVSAHVGGAICAHLIAGQYVAIAMSALILVLCWLGMFLRHPQILWSLPMRGRAGAKFPPDHRIRI